MNKTKQILMTSLIIFGLFLAGTFVVANAAPPIESEEVQGEEAEEEKEELTAEEKKEAKEKKKLGGTLSKLRKYLEGEEKKLRVSGNLFSSKLDVSDCTSADKARARLNDVGDEGGIIVKEDLNIGAHNEANIEKNEGSITNVTEVNIINEVYKRC